MTFLLFGASLADSPATRSAITDRTGEPVEKFTAPGKPLADWARLVPAAGSRPGATAFVVEAGGNGIPTVAQVQAADRKVRATGATRVLWAVFADWPETSRVADARRATRDVIESSGVQVVVLPKPPVSKLVDDRVHFTTEGYRDLGTLLVEGLQQSSSRIGLVVFTAALGLAGWVFWKTTK